MLRGCFKVESSEGALLGQFSYGDTSGHKEIAETAAYERAANVGAQEPNVCVRHIEYKPDVYAT